MIHHRNRGSSCPLCGGWDTLRRGHGERCGGRHNDEICLCTQIPAGTRAPNAGGEYLHLLTRPCECGQEHTSAQLARKTPVVRLVPKKPARLSPRLPEKHPETGAPRTARYDYTSAEGTLCYVVLRFGTGAEKTFLQFAPEGAYWSPSTKHVAKTLYRLPELLATDPARPVYIPEGEKDVDRLVSSGLVATTNAEGAGAWARIADAPELLRGRHVIILEDNDQAGRDRTTAIAASLEDSAASVRVIRFSSIPEKSDVSDWLDAGGNILDLGTMAEPIERAAGSGAGGTETLGITPRSGDSGECSHCAELEREILLKDDLIASLKRANQAAGGRFGQWRDVHTQKGLKDSVKTTMAYVEREFEADRPEDADGFRVMTAASVGKATGHSSKTASANMDRLAELGHLRVKTETLQGTDGLVRTVKMVARGHNFGTSPMAWPELAAEAEQPKKEQRGGKRAGAGRPKLCPECGSAHIKVATRVRHYLRSSYEVTCTNCGVKSVTQPVEEVLSEILTEAPENAENEKTFEYGHQPRQEAAPSSVNSKTSAWGISGFVAGGDSGENDAAGNTERGVEPDTKILPTATLVEGKTFRLVDPNDPIMTYQRRMKTYQDAGMNYLQAARQVEAENKAWWQSQESQESRDELGVSA